MFSSQSIRSGTDQAMQLSPLANTREDQTCHAGSDCHPLQRVANGSPQVQQLRTIQTRANNHLHPDGAPVQRTAIRLGETPIQCLQKDAATYLGTISVGGNHFANQSAPKYTEVINFAKDTSINISIRQQLITEWNKNQTGRWKINPAVAAPSGTFLTAPMSPSHSNYDGNTNSFTGLMNQYGSNQNLFTPSNNSTNSVPTLSSFPEAARTVRAYWNERPSNTSSDRQFLVQTGGMTGLFEAPRKNDYVFTQTSTNSNGDFQRSGGIRPWSTLLGELNSNHSGNFKAVMLNIINSVRGKAQPGDQLVMECVGAMTCDSKWSIQGLMLYLNELENAVNTGQVTSFNQIFGSSGLYTPALPGGRQDPRKKRDNASPSDLSKLN